MKQKVYLICGVAGSGKSWVCKQLSHLIYYNETDKVGRNDPTRSIELHDCNTMTVTIIKRWTAMGIEVVPVFCLGDFLQVKKQLKDRGGKITKGLYSRWKRMNSLNKKFGVFAGSSTEVLKWMKKELKGYDVEHLIYRVTSPSNKVYIGKTMQPLETRQKDHIWLASTGKDGPFMKAIRKYGAQLNWETVEKVRGCEAANNAEKKWIAFYNSCDRNNGYNSTDGGDGGRRSPEAEARRAEAVSLALKQPKTRQKLSTAASAAWSNSSTRIKTIEAIKKSRNTTESRQKTSTASKALWNNDLLRQKMIDAQVARYADATERDKTSAAMLHSKAKTFAAYRGDVLIGTYSNQKLASLELKVPASMISRVLNGRLKIAHGITFKYL